MILFLGRICSIARMKNLGGSSSFEEFLAERDRVVANSFQFLVGFLEFQSNFWYIIWWCIVGVNVLYPPVVDKIVADGVTLSGESTV